MIERRIAWTVALVGAFTMVVSYVDRATLAVLAPSVTEALGISETAYGWLTSAFSIAYLVAVPLSGWWIDRAGARRGLMVSVLVWSSIAALHALVPNFAVMFALRIALGVAEGPSFPGAAQTMYRVLPAADHPRGYSMLFTGSSLGSMVAPVLASWLYGTTGSWRTAFLGTAIFGLLWLPLWALATRRRDVRARLDHPAPEADAIVPAVPRPTFWMLARDPLMIRGLIAIIATAPASGYGLTWSAKYLTLEHNIQQADMGHYLWLPPLGLDIGALVFGDLAARLRRAPGEPPLALLAIATLLASSFAWLPHTTTAWQAVALMSCGLAGTGAIYTLVTADLLSRAPAGSVSLTGGILTGAQSLALIVSSPLIGWTVDHSWSYDAASYAVGVWLVPGTLIWFAWRPAASFRLAQRGSRAQRNPT